MKTERLSSILTLIGGVQSRKWETVMQLVERIADGSATVKHKKWEDDWKQEHPQYHPLDLSEIKTWSTYDDTCIDLRFTNDNSQLACEVKIYDGDSVRGERRKLRFEAFIWLPSSFLRVIEQRIGWAFDSFLEDAYEQHLEMQKKLWIDNLRSKIIK